MRIKNRTCYYFDNIIKLEGFNVNNILIDKKSHENILIYETSYKVLIEPKPLHIRFDQIDGFIRIYDGAKYLTLFGLEEYEVIYDRIRYKKVASHMFFFTISRKSNLIVMIAYL